MHQITPATIAIVQTIEAICLSCFESLSTGLVGVGCSTLSGGSYGLPSGITITPVSGFTVPGITLPLKSTNVTLPSSSDDAGQYYTAPTEPVR